MVDVLVRRSNFVLVLVGAFVSETESVEMFPEFETVCFEMVDDDEVEKDSETVFDWESDCVDVEVIFSESVLEMVKVGLDVIESLSLPETDLDFDNERVFEV